MLTVLFATRNRAYILQKVLEDYCHLEAPSGGWKLVVVDNGSTDETPQVIASLRTRLPIVSLVEPELGKNNGLNSGLKLVEGDLVILTDDDVFPRADWLVRWREAADSHIEYAIFGGAIVPRWEISPPRWLEWVQLTPVFSLTEPLQADGPIRADLVFGPNMAIRANIFLSGIRFDPSIGPRGPNYPMGSETELLLRLGRQGHCSWYVADAIVEHLIRKEQLNKRAVLKRAFRQGRGYYRLSLGRDTARSKLWIGIPRFLFRDIPKFGILTAAAWLTLRREAKFRAHFKLNLLRGIASEARRVSRAQKNQ